MFVATEPDPTLRLSRAKVVMDWLIEHTVEVDRLEAQSAGPSIQLAILDPTFVESGAPATAAPAPAPVAPAPVAPAPAPVAADDAPPASAASARAVDEAFMDLMSRGRRGTAAGAPPPISTTPPASQTRSGPEINDEFNTLLGGAPGRGSSNGR